MPSNRKKCSGSVTIRFLFNKRPRHLTIKKMFKVSDWVNFTLPVGDPPYLIIAGNCQGNVKLN